MRSRLLAVPVAFVLALSAQCGGTQPTPKKGQSPSGRPCGRNGAQTSYKGRLYVCKGVRKNHSGTWRLSEKPMPSKRGSMLV